MDIKLFSLCNQDSQEAEAGKKVISNCVNSFFPESKGFSEFTSQKRMLVAISQSLLAADIVLVAVQSTMYNTTKRLLSAALDMKSVTYSEVASAIQNKLDQKKIKQTTYNANISFPMGATLFPTDDYINCGFAITSGGQHIIFMPVEDEKAQQVVFGSLYDYFAELCEPYVVSNAIKERHIALINRTIKKLADDSVKVAVVGNDSSDYLVSFLSKKASSVFTVDMNYELPDNKDLKESSISAARTVRDNNHADLGVYISEPYVNPIDGKNYCVYITVANSEGTAVYLIESDGNEKSKDILKVAVDKLLMLIYNYEKLGNINSEEETAAEKKADSNLKGILGIVASATVLLASIAGFITALFMR